MVCWDMWSDSSGHSCQYHMKIMRENKVVNPVGPWEGRAMQFWARFHPMQLLFQDGSKDHHSIS
eukprot:611307-Prorocentrum_lima.AAC.1